MPKTKRFAKVQVSLFFVDCPECGEGQKNERKNGSFLFDAQFDHSKKYTCLECGCEFRLPDSLTELF